MFLTVITLYVGVVGTSHLCHWRQKMVNLTTLLSLLASQVVITTTYNATSHDKVVKVMIFCFLCYSYPSGLLHWHWGNYMSEATQRDRVKISQYLTTIKHNTANREPCTYIWGCNMIPVDQSHKSHNAPVPYPTMHHFGTEMRTFLFQSDALWDMGQVHCGIC